nr:glycosyltransferase family 39 protein [candidate division Zixibacteria bacterium]
MSLRIKLRHLVPAALIVCALVRLVFILAVPQLPVMWDARIYSSAALGLIGYLENPERFGHPELDSPADSSFYRARFDHTMNEYIEGEQIEWLYYNIPSVHEAQDYIFLSGPVYPLSLSAIFAANSGDDFLLVRILNIFIDCLSLLLLILISVKLFDIRAAVLAAVLFIFYQPFILMAGMVSPEPLTIMFILLILYLILCWYEKGDYRYPDMAGLILGILFLTKPTAALLCLPFGLGVIYDLWQERRRSIIGLSGSAIMFAIIVIPWIIINSIYYGSFSIRDPEYSDANIRSSSSIKYEGYDLDYTDVDFWIAPTAYSIKTNLFSYGHLLLKKTIRLWGKPYNDFNQRFILGSSLNSAWHLIIVIGGLFGAFMFITGPGKGRIFLLSIPLYYTLLHIIFHSLARYNLNPMPFLIIAASGALIAVGSYIHEKVNVKNLWGWLLFVAGILFILLFPEKWFIPLLGVKPGVIALVVLKAIILVALGIVLLVAVSSRIGHRAALKSITIPIIILLALLLFVGHPADSWTEWSCRLDKPDQKAGLRIYFPPDFRLGENDLVRVGIDLTTSKNCHSPFIITLNGDNAPLYIHRPPINRFYYNKMTYNVFETLYDFGQEEMRAWRFIPINTSVFNGYLDCHGFIDISIGTGAEMKAKGEFLNLYGNYKIGGVDSLNIPSLTHHSIERFVEKGDPRIWVDYKLSSDSAISYYIADDVSKRADSSDLSPSTGYQEGRYRIIIEVKRFDESRYYY